MKLQIFEYQCEPLGHAFRAPELPVYAYGEFLLRSETGAEMVCVNAISDPTYKEVDVLLQRHPSLTGVPAIKRADILRRISCGGYTARLLVTLTLRDGRFILGDIHSAQCAHLLI